MKKILLAVSFFATGTLVFGALTKGKQCRIGGTPCKEGLSCQASKDIADNKDVRRCLPPKTKK